MISKYYHTIVNLKAKQIRYQIWYRIRLYYRKLIKFNYSLQIVKDKDNNSIIFEKAIEKPCTLNNSTFTFLNLSKNFSNNFDKNSFVNKINWNYIEYGKLWAYNLNYMDYLLQFNVENKTKFLLIEHFINNVNKNKIGLDPYPISLRAINWIIFITTNQSNEENFHTLPIRTINASLYQQYKILLENLEYHLLGNHLLENGFSLLFGAYYFNDSNLYLKAKNILISELTEQILPDGAHFELSPMYHCTILNRLLDCYNLVSNNNLFGKELEPCLKVKGELMLSWINRMAFRNGKFPLFNDSAFNVSPTINQLNEYAFRLGWNRTENISLNESGYRKFTTDKFELIADIGNIGPDYQTGHAHADTFSFELNVNCRPVIVDTGTSTYDKNETRFYERSTAAHNTVVVNNSNSSEVWASHRVAKKARVKILRESNILVCAIHDGYSSQRISHNRCFECKDEFIKITDSIDSLGFAYLHFHPNEKINFINNSIIGVDYIINFIGAMSIESFISEYSPEFNKRVKSISARILFHDKLITIFK